MTIAIKTYRRSYLVNKLVNSINFYYPDVRTIVITDKEDNLELQGNAELIVTEDDIGLSAGRNLALEMTKTEFLCVLDDDMEFIPETSLENALYLLQNTDVFLTSFRNYNALTGYGQVLEGRLDRTTDKAFVYKGDGLTERQIGRLTYFTADVTANQWVARTRDIRSVGAWRDELHHNDHMEFFYRVGLTGRPASFIKDNWILHRPLKNKAFRKGRRITRHFLKRKMLGVSDHEWIGMTQTLELPLSRKKNG